MDSSSLELVGTLTISEYSQHSASLNKRRQLLMSSRVIPLSELDIIQPYDIASTDLTCVHSILLVSLSSFTHSLIHLLIYQFHRITRITGLDLPCVLSLVLLTSPFCNYPLAPSYY